MKIAYILTQFPKPSETFITREIIGLEKLGLEIKIFAFESPNESEILNLTPSARKLMAKTKYLEKRDIFKVSPMSWLNFFRIFQKRDSLFSSLFTKVNPIALLTRAIILCDFLNKDNFDHIHAHWPYSSKVGDLIFRLTGKQYSISVHAHEVVHENEHFPCVFNNISFAAFCNKAAMLNLLDKLPSQVHHKAHLIYHGVDLAQFPDTFNLNNGSNLSTINIISSGRLTATKGFDRLIKACSHARENGVDINLTIMGGGDPKYEKCLLEIAEESNFHNHLKLTGWIPFDRVFEYLGKADIFALLASTNFHDGLPNVVLEAMACRKPIIISPIPAATEAITSGVEGFILDSPEDNISFLKAVKMLSGDRKLLAQMGKNSFSRVKNDHDQTVHLKKLFNLFYEK